MRSAYFQSPCIFVFFYSPIEPSGLSPSAGVLSPPQCVLHTRPGFITRPGPVEFVGLKSSLWRSQGSLGVAAEQPVGRRPDLTGLPVGCRQ